MLAFRLAGMLTALDSYTSAEEEGALYNPMYPIAGRTHRSHERTVNFQRQLDLLLLLPAQLLWSIDVVAQACL